MQALKFPFRIGLDGRISTATTYAEVVRGQFIDALMTNFHERVHRPQYGCDIQSALFDPTDALVRADAAQLVASRTNDCTPRVIMESIGFHDDLVNQSTVFLDAVYRVGIFDEVEQLRMPVSVFLSEETEI